VKKNRSNRSLLLYTVLAIVAIVAAVTLLNHGGGPKQLSTADFNARLAANQVATAQIKDHSNKVVGQLTDGTKYEMAYPDSSELKSSLVTQLDNAAKADGSKLDLKATDQQTASLWITILTGYLPFVLIIGLFLLFMNSMQGGGGRVMQFGKAKARQMGPDQPKVTFDDVAGADEAVEELVEIKEFLENPARFQAMGAKIPKGVLLFGPPGTGKTLLARAVAGEAGVPFFSISGSDFVEMFVGVGASRVRDLFEQAKTAAPAIIFMDEIDAVGRHRGAGHGGGHDEREQTLNQLLVEMDGFDPRTGIILIAATNRPDILDPALLRPGRFDRQIVVDKPDLAGRRRILDVHAVGKPLSDGVELGVLAKRTPGFTGADLANLMNEAALLSARRNLDVVGMEQLEEAIDRVLAGPERRSRVMTEEEKKLIAYHEAGHALVGHILPEGDEVHKVSIVARGRALGLTWFLPEDRYTHSKAQLRAQMAATLGGRTAEELVFGEITTGAANDIEKCTELARAMVTQFGMSDRLGPRKFGADAESGFLGRPDGSVSRDYSDEIAEIIDAEVNALIDGAHETALAVLSTHRELLDNLAYALIDKETLDDAELADIWAGVEPWNKPLGDGRPRNRRRPVPGDHPDGSEPPARIPVTAAPAVMPREGLVRRVGRAWRGRTQGGQTAT
jgi:cell division protease FtsH